MKSHFFRLLFLSGCFFILFNVQGCFLPWIGNDTSEKPAISIFDKNKFLEVHEYDFPEYKWNNSAMFAEEMYAKAMADYYFTGQYQKALELFESARKVYKKDARIYVRIVECHARLGEYQKALDILGEAEKELNGFGRIEGITSYRTQLSQSLEKQQSKTEQSRRPLWKRILFAPAKLWPF